MCPQPVHWLLQAQGTVLTLSELLPNMAAQAQAIANSSAAVRGLKLDCVPAAC